MICAEIATAEGWIPFTRYMELAIYAPGMGYYCSGAAKFGGAGDFVTAPEISPLFGRAIARQGAQVLECMGEDSGDILEFGAGTGKLALDLLLELEKLERLPKHYFILEVSGELRKRQKELFEKFAPHLLSRVGWLEHMPTKFKGLILANEVLDAMPVHLVVWRGTSLFERGVAWNGSPAIAGVLIVWLDIGTVMAIGSLTFFQFFVVLLFIRVDEPGRDRNLSLEVFADIMTGVKYVLGDPGLRFLMILLGAT
ncbi:MAG: SAM-dependent methyltransferase, partial [Nitrosomonadaceae bacterium]